MKRTSALLLTLPVSLLMASAAYAQENLHASAASSAIVISPAAHVAPNLVAVLGTATVPVASVPVGLAAVLPLPRTGVGSGNARPGNAAPGTGKQSAVAAGNAKNLKSPDAKKKGKFSGKSAVSASAARKVSGPAAAALAAALKARREMDLATRIISTAEAPEMKSASADEKRVALTFDDGPAPVYTAQVLAILKQYGIHATFCLVGRQVKKYPELVKQIVEEGHKIADHTMNHDEFLTRRSDKKIKQEVFAEVALIQSVVPETPIEYFRAPGGNWNYHVRKLAASWGMKSLGWSVDSKDWQQPGVDTIIANVNKQLHPGAVILMHDAGGNRSETIKALKKLIPSLKKDGYQFCFPG